MFTFFFTVSNLISISLKFHPIGSSRFFNWLSMATGSRGDVFVIRTSKPIETSEKMGYFNRVTVSLVVSLCIV